MTASARRLTPRGVDRCPPARRAVIYDTHLRRVPATVTCGEHGTITGAVIEIADDTFTVATGAGARVVTWTDLQAAAS